MKYSILFILISSFVIFGFKETVVVGFYQLNKEYITKNYCVNKEKSEMKCDGKCHMKKMLKKSKEKEQESFPEGTLDFKFVTYIKPHFNQNFISIVQLNNQLFNLYDENLIGVPSFTDIFHPPKV